MNIGSAFPSKYLKASDIPESQFVTVQINHVEIENVAGSGDPEDDKPVLYFIGKQKGMVLNKTNSNAISTAYGYETDDWQGKTVQLYATETEFQGKRVPCLRVKVPKGGAAVAGARPQRPTVAQRQTVPESQDVPADGEIDPDSIQF